MTILRQEGPYPWRLRPDFDNPITNIKENIMSGTPLANEAAKAINPQPRPSGRIAIELEVLDKTIYELDQALRGVYEKLSPVMGPDSIREAEPTPEDSQTSEVSYIVQSQSRRLQEMNRVLDNIFTRLEC